VVTWTAPSSDGGGEIKLYKPYIKFLDGDFRKMDGVNAPTLTFTIPIDNPDVKQFIQNLPDSTLIVKVSAYNSAGESLLSGESIPLVLATAPIAPGNPSATEDPCQGTKINPFQVKDMVSTPLSGATFQKIDYKSDSVSATSNTICDAPKYTIEVPAR